MRKALPTIVGYGLGPGEKAILEYWLALYDYKPVASVPEILQRGNLPLFWPEASLQQIQELRDWNLPLLLATNHNASRAEFFQLGLAALYCLPEPGQPIVFPTFAAKNGRWIYVCNADTAERNLLRQICFQAGYEVRTDFRNTAELTAIENEAEVLILKIDGLKLAELDNWLAVQQKKPLVLLLRDFASSAPTLQDMFYLKRLGRRIFSFAEAFFVLMEGLLYNEAEPGAFNSLRSLLLAEKVTLIKEAPDWRKQPLAFERGLVFLWLYDFMATSSQGVIIK